MFSLVWSVLTHWIIATPLFFIGLLSVFGYVSVLALQGPSMCVRRWCALRRMCDCAGLGFLFCSFLGCAYAKRRALLGVPA